MFRLRDSKKGSVAIPKLPDGVMFFEPKPKGTLRHELYHIAAVASSSLREF